MNLGQQLRKNSLRKGDAYLAMLARRERYLESAYNRLLETLKEDINERGLASPLKYSSMFELSYLSVDERPHYKSPEFEAVLSVHLSEGEEALFNRRLREHGLYFYTKAWGMEWYVIPRRWWHVL